MTAITKQPDRFVETDIDDEIVIMRLDNGDFFSLAGTSAAVWRLIDGVRDRPALVAALSNEFDGDRGQIAADVDELIERLADIGLLGGR